MPSGLSTVSVLTLDPSSSAPGPATSVVAAGDTVYASPDHLYVAGLTQDVASPRSGFRTQLYDFSTVGAHRPRFVGAGSVPGSLLNSYAMDQDANGFLEKHWCSKVWWAILDVANSFAPCVSLATSPMS